MSRPEERVDCVEVFSGEWSLSYAGPSPPFYTPREGTEYSRDRESPAAPIIVGPFGLVIAVLLPASGLVPSRGLRSEEGGVVLAVVRQAPTLCLLCRRPR